MTVPGVLGLDRHLHLHRLEHDDDVALGDLIADGALDLPDDAGDVRRNRGHSRRDNSFGPTARVAIAAGKPGGGPAR